MKLPNRLFVFLAPSVLSPRADKGRPGSLSLVTAISFKKRAGIGLEEDGDVFREAEGLGDGDLGKMCEDVLGPNCWEELGESDALSLGTILFESFCFNLRSCFNHWRQSADFWKSKKMGD